MEKFKGMFIDEDKIDLDISDHNLIRAWFNMGVSEEIKWKKPRYEIIEWYKMDTESLINMKKELESMLGNRTGFYHTMEKNKNSIE